MGWGNMIVDVVLFMVRIVVEVLFAWTGEVILFVFTLGRHKPRWDLYASDRPIRFVVFSEVSTWIGIAFWLLVAAVVARLLVRASV